MGMGDVGEFITSNAAVSTTLALSFLDEEPVLPPLILPALPPLEVDADNISSLACGIDFDEFINAVVLTAQPTPADTLELDPQRAYMRWRFNTDHAGHPSK